jgi:hypothetical protein
VNGFTGATGDRFDFMTFASRSGDFATFNLPPGSGFQRLPSGTAYALNLPGPVANVTAGNTAEMEVVTLNDRFLGRIEQRSLDDERNRLQSASMCN